MLNVCEHISAGAHKPKCKASIAIACHLRCGVAPLHEHIHSMLGTSCVTLNFPAKSILVGNGSTTSGINIVFARATADDGDYRTGCSSRLCIGSSLQNLIGSCDSWIAIS